MKNLTFCLLLFFTNPVTANAYQIPTEIDSVLNPVIEIGDDINKQAPAAGKAAEKSRISLQTVAVPPATWVVGFGLCLVFLGYMMKNKIH